MMKTFDRLTSFCLRVLCVVVSWTNWAKKFKVDLPTRVPHRGSIAVISCFSDQITEVDKFKVILFCTMVLRDVFEDRVDIRTVSYVEGFSPDHFSMNVEETLKDLMHRWIETPGVGRVVVLTDLNLLLSVTLKSVYGYAGTTIPIGIISTDKFMLNKGMKRWDFFMKILLHEVGHTFGLNHCVNDCVMRDVGSVGIGALRSNFCEVCRLSIPTLDRSSYLEYGGETDGFFYNSRTTSRGDAPSDKG